MDLDEIIFSQHGFVSWPLIVSNLEVDLKIQFRSVSGPSFSELPTLYRSGCVLADPTMEVTFLLRSPEYVLITFIHLICI